MLVYQRVIHEYVPVNLQPSDLHTLEAIAAQGSEEVTRQNLVCTLNK